MKNSFNKNNKFALLSLPALLLLIACGGIQNPPPTPTPTPGQAPPYNVTSSPLPSATTAAGTSISGGTVLSLNTGPEGGSISSADGVFTLIVPPGALGASGTVSLEVINNMMPGGIGPAYRIGVSGTKLLSALQLEATLPDEFLSDVDDADVLVGFQSSDGQWNINETVTRVPVTATQSVSTHTVVTHTVSKEAISTLATPLTKIKLLILKPGDYAVANRYQLNPQNATVFNGHHVWMSVMMLSARKSSQDAAGFSSLQVNTTTASDWKVNGILGGGNGLGTIEGEGAKTGIYTAPNTPPNPNTVNVTTTVVGTNGRSVLLKAKVRIVKLEAWTHLLGFASGHQEKSGDGVYEKLDATINLDWLTQPAKAATIAKPSLGVGIYQFDQITSDGDYTATVNWVRKVDQLCGCSTGKYQYNESYSFYAADSVDLTARANITGSYTTIDNEAISTITQNPISVDGKFEHIKTYFAQCSTTNPSPNINEKGNASIVLKAPSFGFQDTLDTSKTGKISGINSSAGQITLPLPNTASLKRIIPVTYTTTYFLKFPALNTLSPQNNFDVLTPSIVQVKTPVREPTQAEPRLRPQC